MLASKIMGRILSFAYPAIVITFAFLIWSSSDLAAVAHLAPPPVNEGFNFFWNPSTSARGSCNEKPNSKFKLKQVCSTAKGEFSLDQLTSGTHSNLNQPN